MPAFRFTAREILFALLASHCIAWRVTAAAMSQSIDEVASAVPLFAPGSVGSDGSRAKVQLIPDGEQRSRAERHAQLVLRSRRRDRRTRPQVREDRVHVVVV